MQKGMVKTGIRLFKSFNNPSQFPLKTLKNVSLLIKTFNVKRTNETAKKPVFNKGSCLNIASCRAERGVMVTDKAAETHFVKKSLMREI